jgi:hypothetical protein
LSLTSRRLWRSSVSNPALIIFVLALSLALLGTATPAPHAGATSTMLVGTSSGTSEPFALQRTDYHPSGLQVAHFSNGVKVAGSGGETVSYHVYEVEEDGVVFQEGLLDIIPAENSSVPGTWTTYDALVALGSTAEELREMGVSTACPHLDKERCPQHADVGG